MTDSTPNPCCVYIIQDAHGAVKIGIAADVNARLRDLQVGNSHELKVLYNLQVANRKAAQEIEGLLHRRYASDALRGEWFSTNAEHLIADVEFAVSVGTAIQRFTEEYPPKRKPTLERDLNPIIHLSAAELDVVARWAIERNAISLRAVLDEFHLSTPRGKAIMYTFWRLNCLVSIEGQPGEYRYDPNWTTREVRA